MIRYLVSFNDQISISGAEINVNDSVKPNTTTIYSPFLKADVDGYKDRDDYLATNVQYAPLSSESVTNDFLITNSTSGGHTIMTFYGVFNEEFTFRKVIDGKNTDSTYYDTTTYKTDRFLTDFFQFIPYDYVNEELIKTIGWQTGAYLDAANKFANSLAGMYTLFDKIGYESDIASALNTSTWSPYANQELLLQIVDQLVESKNVQGILNYIQYIFSSDNVNSALFTNEIRANIVTYIYDNYSNLIDTNALLTFENGYSTILANTLSINATNDVKTDVLTYIDGYIESLDGVTKENLLLAYIDYLKTNGASFFNTGTTNVSKYVLLEKLFSNINENSFYVTLWGLFNSTNQGIITDFSTALSGYGGFKALTDQEKVDFFTSVVNNNTDAEIKTYLDAFATEIGMFDYLRSDGYNEPSLSDLNTNIAYTSTNNSNEDIIDERVKLWNKIKETNTFKTWFKGLLGDTKRYELATEHNNTYQTDSAPIPYGVTELSAFNNVANPNLLGQTSDVNFIYTETVTPSTYFYGPYANPPYVIAESFAKGNTYYTLNNGVYTAAFTISNTTYYSDTSGSTASTFISGHTYYTRSGNRWSGYTYTAAFTIANNTTYYLNRNLNDYIPKEDGTTLSTTAQGTVNKNSSDLNATDFDTPSNNTTSWYSVVLTEGIDDSIASVATGKSNAFNRAQNPLVIRKRTTGNYDNSSNANLGVGISYLTKKTDHYVLVNGTIRQNIGNVILKRDSTDPNNKEYMLGNTPIDCGSGDTYRVYSNGTELTTEAQSDWTYLLNNYVYTATVNTVTSDWHESERTGIYVKFTIARRTSPYQIRIEYTNKYMFTTRYIDYSADQLLKLDGVLSTYGDHTTQHKDERDIINKLFNEILLTDSNRTKFTQIVAKALFETLSSNTSNHVDFINNFVDNGVSTKSKVNNQNPFDYLMYNSSLTINDYLDTLASTTDPELKKKILNAASNNINVFTELFEILFTSTTTEGEGGGDGTNYGSSFDVQKMATRIGYMYANQGSNTPSSYLPATESSTVLAKGSYAPLTVANSIDSATYSGANAKETASAQNIGYYLGNQNKIYSKSIEFSDLTTTLVDNGAKTNYSWDEGTTPRTFFVRTGDNATATSENIRALTNEEFNALPKGIKALIPNSNTTVNYNTIRLQQRFEGTEGSDDGPKYCAKDGISYYGQTYNSVYLPNNGIWVRPKAAGKFRFVVYSGDNGKIFTLYKWTRSSITNKITNSSTVDLHSGSLPSYALFYFELEVSETDIQDGVEYLLGNDTGSQGAYFLYMDMGITSEENTKLVRDKIKDLHDYDDYLNEIITYLTPLNASATQIGNTSYTIADYQNLVFCERFMTLLASSSNEAIYKLISTINNKDALIDILKYIVKLNTNDTKDGRKHFDSIVKYLSNPENSAQLTDTIKKYLCAGYYSTDYYRKYRTDITSTLLKEKLDTDALSTYQYITGEQAVSPATFKSFCTYIGYKFELFYGIFALASNEGIQNGVFIPDNLNLDRIDPEYTTDTNVGFKLIETNKDIDTSLTDAKWRGGTGTEEGEDDISGYTGNNVTVNQAFYIEMKQLNKSISTVVFELTLEKDNTLYYGDIDLDKGTITYYVESLSTGTYNVENLDLAYGAKAYNGKITEATGTRFNNDSTISVAAVNVTSHQFTVFAEDTRVYKTYSIIFKELTTTLTMEYNTTKTTGTTDATHLTVSTGTADKQVVLNITSNNDKLPKGFDLKPYLSLTDGTNTYSMDSEYVKISTISTDHKIKDNGTAEATLTISYKLPAGTYQIRLSICGQTKAVEYKKEASDACDITKIKFNGTELTVAAAMTSNIKFGRAYNNIELTDIAGTYSDYYNFYLDELVVSENATVTASVAKVLTQKSYKFDADTTVTYNITSYVVTYIVTAENGIKNKTYTHTLTEYDPYDSTNHKYGNIYKDGVTDSSNTEFDSTVDDGTRNQTYVSFERGNEAYYRLKYDFSRIYTLSSNIVYSMEETTTSDLAGVATFNLEYRGISADVNEFCDAGTYSFLYKYKNTQEWGLEPHETDGVFDGTFTKTKADSYIEYTFPRLVIEKTYSTDATLHSIVLMDAYTAAATASTVMSINNLRPTEEHLVTAEHEEYYQNLITSAPIYVGDEINYQYTGSTDFSGATYTDYYSVGTVSNAQLSNYAPTFSIESHAMMFQSTTLAKIKNYGSDKQGNATDASILGDHISTDGSVLFLFLPFTYEETENNKTVTKTTVFLGKLEDKEITDIYPVDYDGTGSSIATLNMTLNEIRAMKLDSTITRPSFTNGGISYTLSDAVGNATNNPSLNMDYIGTPVDDHFWYVSYVVFSEDYIRNTSSYTHIKFYHIALIDHDNNVYFTIKVVTPKDATFTSINDIYITVLGYKTNEEDNTKFDEIVVGAYVKKAVVDNTNNTITYELKYSIQILPSAYYYFYIDLPGGYVATSEITDSSKANTNQRQDGEDYADAYLPPASIVVQRVPVTITVTTGTEEDSSWAIATSDIYTRLATLNNDSNND